MLFLRTTNIKLKIFSYEFQIFITILEKLQFLFTLDFTTKETMAKFWWFLHNRIQNKGALNICKVNVCIRNFTYFRAYKVMYYAIISWTAKCNCNRRRSKTRRDVTFCFEVKQDIYQMDERGKHYQYTRYV